jgi:hypothetical protein
MDIKLTRKEEQIYLMRRQIILLFKNEMLTIRDIVEDLGGNFKRSLVEYHVDWLESNKYIKRYDSPFKVKKPVNYLLNPDNPFDVDMKYTLITKVPVRLMTPEQKREYRQQVKQRKLEGFDPNRKPTKEEETQVEVQIAPHIRMIYNSRRPAGFYSYQNKKSSKSEVYIGSTMALI